MNFWLVHFRWCVCVCECVWLLCMENVKQILWNFFFQPFLLLFPYFILSSKTDKIMTMKREIRQSNENNVKRIIMSFFFPQQFFLLKTLYSVSMERDEEKKQQNISSFCVSLSIQCMKGFSCFIHKSLMINVREKKMQCLCVYGNL